MKMEKIEIGKKNKIEKMENRNYVKPKLPNVEEVFEESERMEHEMEERKSTLRSYQKGHRSEMAPYGSVVGNTKPRVTASLFWFMTWNNYKEDRLAPFIEALENECEMFIMEREVGDSGTPHIQGKIKFYEKNRPIEKFGKMTEYKISWRKSKVWKGADYCVKDGTEKGYDVWWKGWDPILAPKIWGWQQDVVDSIPEMEERKIYWYYEEKGKMGKTDLARYLCIRKKGIMLGGKAGDMKTCLVGMKVKPELIIINLVRSARVSYIGLEEVSDGIFFSGKYESEMCIMKKPKIIVLSNVPPEVEKMSMDRWVVNKVTKDGLKFVPLDYLLTVV